MADRLNDCRDALQDSLRRRALVQELLEPVAAVDVAGEGVRPNSGGRRWLSPG